MAKQRLVENVLVPSRMIDKVDIPLTEETIKDSLYKALAVYRFPFTRPGQKNLNGRIYPYALWDKVFKEFQSRSTLCLMDHPEDGPGDPTRIWAVARNPRYSDDRTIAYVDCYIIDNEHGKTINGLLEAGGDIGLSTSGVGDFEVDGVTVAPETYELERFFDAVLSPSYFVFGSLDDKISEAAMTNKNNQTSVDLQENKTGENMKKTSLREKRVLELSLKKIYEDIKGTKDLREKLARAKESLTFYEDSETEAYKKEFEELVKETEKEFEETLAKCEQADTAKKEAEESSQKAEDAKKEAEELKKENEELKKENNQLKSQVETSLKLKNESEAFLTKLTSSTRRSIDYNDYEKLREYALHTTRLYRELKIDRNLLQIKIQEMSKEKKALEEAQMRQYQKDAAARANVERIREQNAVSKAMQEQRLKEAKEREFMNKVNPDVLEYYNDLLRMGENVIDLREQILSRRTLNEAQLFFLKAKYNNQTIKRTTPIRDLSVPLPVTNCRQILPDISLTLPKGYI